MEPMNTTVERATLWGDVWVRIANLPRPIAESWRVLLTQRDIPSALKTPWGWITTTNIIELEAGTYYGGVSLFVIETQAQAARDVLGLEEDERGLTSAPLENG
jgi:hypothetical protein